MHRESGGRDYHAQAPPRYPDRNTHVRSGDIS